MKAKQKFIDTEPVCGEKIRVHASKHLNLSSSLKETAELSEKEAQTIGDSAKTSETIIQINRHQMNRTYVSIPCLTCISRGHFIHSQFDFVISKHVYIDPRT